MWSKIAAGAYGSDVQQMPRKRLGACTISLLSEEAGTSAPAMMTIGATKWKMKITAETQRERRGR
jgi:hypothetical protein